MRLAITGGAGFLGYHICSELSVKYSEILILDTSPINLSEYPPNVHFIKTDVRQSAAVRDSLKSCDAVIHAAAALPLYSHQQIFATNIEGTRNVLQAMCDQGITRVIFISSTAVYGVPLKHPIEETDALVGVGPYGESKIAAEKICEEYRQKGLCVPIIRPKTFIGMARLGVFQILYDWIYNGKKIPVIGAGRNRYQLLEVTDLVSAIDLLLSGKEDVVNDTFNIGAERFNTVREDLNALCDYAQSGACVIGTPAWLVKGLLSFFEKLHLSPLYKWVYETADKDSFVSVEKIKKKCGWAARYSNAEAMIRSYQWYLAHLSEISTGITHRAAWRQGILGFVKKIM